MARSKVSGARSAEATSKKQKLYREFRALTRALADIEVELESGGIIDNATGESFSDPSAAERWAMIFALDAVNRFLLFQGIHSRLLYQLGIDLDALRFGIASPLLTPLRARAGRKQDSRVVSELKGRIARIARLQMASGQSRDHAAAWAARKITPALASRLSSKQVIQASAVKEWMDRYDCGTKILDMFARNDGREAFESCFLVSNAADEGTTNRFIRQMEFLRQHVPENKRLNPIHGLLGFMIEAYSGALHFAHLVEGHHQPNFNQLFIDLERRAIELIGSDFSAAANS
jgi:hypothetical protein